MTKRPAKPALVYSTAPSRKEAESIVSSLLRLRLIACGNIVASSSSYVWKGRPKKTHEHVLLLKTTTQRFDAVKREIRRRSSYDCPCIILFKIDAGYEPYLDWLRACLL